jgi:glutamate N-acetyltransferase/amino-acid N-acetyltransferase
MISVEGDMSTNDTVIAMSDGSIRCKSKDFQLLLNHVLMELAKMIAKDGEGATKFIEVRVEGAKDGKSAKKAVKAIVNSPLVKTAFYGENPNWGRIISSVGAATKIDWECVELSLSSGGRTVKLLSKGRGLEPEAAKKVLKRREIILLLNLNLGKATACGWGCDMSPEYIRINAGYN